MRKIFSGIAASLLNKINGDSMVAIKLTRDIPHYPGRKAGTVVKLSDRSYRITERGNWVRVMEVE